MTRKHFEAMARIINDNRLAAVNANSLDGVNYVYATALDMVGYFASQNPLFDRQRFLTACGF